MADQETTEDKIFAWMLIEGADVIGEAVNELTLKTDGSHRVRCERLRKWLLGQNTAEDFLASSEEDGNEAAVKVKREQLWASYIVTTMWEKPGSTILDPDYTHTGEHPFAVLMDEPIIHQAANPSVKSTSGWWEFKLWRWRRWWPWADSTRPGQW